MRTAVRSAALVLAAAPLTACSVIGPIVASQHLGGQGTGSPVSSGSAGAKPGPLGVLPMPSGARPWDSNGTGPMSIKAFVRSFYKTTAWSDEEGLFAQRKYVTGINRGWINSDGTQQSIAIMRFANTTGAQSQLDGLVHTLYDNLPKGGTRVSDPSDGAAGTVDPQLDSLGNTRVELAVRIGTEVIDVHQFNAATPDPAAAKALLLKQVKALRAGKQHG